MPLPKRILYHPNSFYSNEHFENETAPDFEGQTMSKLIGTLQQLSQLALMASEIFENLSIITYEANQRTKSLANRTEQAIKKFTDIDRHLQTIEPKPDTHIVLYSEKYLKNRVPIIPPLFVRGTNCQALLDQYKYSTPLPQLWKIENILEEDCYKNYSYPGYFFQEWLRIEIIRQEKAKLEKKKTKALRKLMKKERKQQRLLQQQDQLRKKSLLEKRQKSMTPSESIEINQVQQENKLQGHQSQQEEYDVEEEIINIRQHSKESNEETDLDIDKKKSKFKSKGLTAVFGFLAKDKQPKEKPKDESEKPPQQIEKSSELKKGKRQSISLSDSITMQLLQDNKSQPRKTQEINKPFDSSKSDNLQSEYSDNQTSEKINEDKEKDSLNQTMFSLNILFDNQEEFRDNEFTQMGSTFRVSNRRRQPFSANYTPTSNSKLLSTKAFDSIPKHLVKPTQPILEFPSQDSRDHLSLDGSSNNKLTTGHISTPQRKKRNSVIHAFDNTPFDSHASAGMYNRAFSTHSTGTDLFESLKADVLENHQQLQDIIMTEDDLHQELDIEEDDVSSLAETRSTTSNNALSKSNNKQHRNNLDTISESFVDEDDIEEIDQPAVDHSHYHHSKYYQNQPIPNDVNLPEVTDDDFNDDNNFDQELDIDPEEDEFLDDPPLDDPEDDISQYNKTPYPPKIPEPPKNKSTMPPPPPPPPKVKSSLGDTILADIRTGTKSLRKAQVQPKEPKEVDIRTKVLDSIKAGNAQLKKVAPIVKKDKLANVRQNEAVAAILANRSKIAGSDSESSDSDSDFTDDDYA